MTTPRVGDVLAGRFRLLEVRDRRRDRLVFAAADEQGGRAVSVHWPVAEEAVATFRREVDRSRRVRHPAIVPVLGLWREGARHFLVVGRREPELSLAALGRVDPARAALWLADVAAGLDALHRAGMAHGDVRPTRVRITGDRARIEIAARPVLLPGEVAPELLDGGTVGVASDVYGLGLVLAAAVAGSAFRGSTPWAIRAAQDRVPTLPTSVPRGVRQLVAVCLHPDPARRPRTAGAVARMAKEVARAPRRRLRAWGAVPIRWRSSQLVLARSAGGDWVRVGGATSRTDAARRRARCEAAGAEVKVVQVALDGRDMLWIGVVALGVGLVVPVVGGPLGGWLAWQRRARACTPAAGIGLERVDPPAPPPVPAGRFRMLTVGGLLVVAAVLALVAPAMAIAPALVALGVIATLWWPDRPSLARRARTARVRAALDDAEAALVLHAPPLDEALDLEGRIRSVRALDAAAVPPGAVEAWADEARRHPSSVALPVSTEAIARTRAEWDDDAGP